MERCTVIAKMFQVDEDERQLTTFTGPYAGRYQVALTTDFRLAENVALDRFIVHWPLRLNSSGIVDGPDHLEKFTPHRHTGPVRKNHVARHLVAGSIHFIALEPKLRRQANAWLDDLKSLTMRVCGMEYIPGIIRGSRRLKSRLSFSPKQSPEPRIHKP